MGLYGHFYVEARDPSAPDAPWVSLDTWEEETCEGETWQSQASCFYSGSNYVLLHLLFGGFGIGTLNEWDPICEERGVPHDADPRVFEEASNPYASPSWKTWLTVGELVRYDWSRELRIGFVTSPRHFVTLRTRQLERLERGGRTRNVTTDGIPGTSLLFWRTRRDAREHAASWLSEAEADAILARVDEPRLTKKERVRRFVAACPKPKIHAVETISVGELFPDWMTYYLPKLRSLGDPDHVRVVIMVC